MQLTIFDALMGNPQPISSGKTSPACSRPAIMPSAPSWQDLSEAIPPSFRQKGPDGLTQVWLLDPKDAPHGGVWTPSTSAWPNDGSGSSCSLVSILEAGPVPTRYFLSSKACAGILRRAAKRGKELPPPLRRALEAVAGSERISTATGD